MKNKYTKKPELKDFYDEMDPRGCSSSEYNDYQNALKEYWSEVLKQKEPAKEDKEDNENSDKLLLLS